MSKEDEELEELSKEVAQMISQQDGFTPPEMVKDSQYKFMRELLITTDSKKIANLSNDEIGNCPESMRGSLMVAQLAEALDLEPFRKYFIDQAEIIAATSMSRKMSFAQLLFTQIKKTIAGIQSSDSKPKGFFSGFKKSTESEHYNG